MRTLYLLVIALSNLVTAKYSPFILFNGILVVPAGSIFAGAVFVLRDLVQIKHGKKKTYTTILTAVVLSAAMSVVLGDTAHIAAASAAAFIASEAIDTEIFSRLQKSFAARVMLSGIIGGTADSILFVIIGMSPLGANMIPWSKIPAAVLGQMLVKAAVQALAACCLILRNKKRVKSNKKGVRHETNQDSDL